MSREKIKNKYGMSLEQPAAIVTDRKLSPAVAKLRAFILENKRHGIQLVIKDGRPALRFVPGLNKGNTERWDACLAAEVLLFEAAPDLMKLIDEQKLELDDRAPDPAEPVQLQEQLFQGEMKEKRLYDTVRWRKLRARFLDAHPLCALCWVIDRDTPATVVDHIKPHGGDPVLFWDEDNWQPLCASCHSGKKRLQENRGHSAAAGLDGMPLDGGHPWAKGRGV